MDKEQAKALLEKYNSGQCTEAEKSLIEQSFLAFNEQPIDVSFQKLKAIKKQVAQELPKPNIRTSSLSISITLLTAAAMIALAVYIFMPQPEKGLNHSLTLAESIFPKGNVAVITLSNGKVIELNKNKREIKVNGTDLVYSDGSMVYDNYKTEFQTISTSKGGEYKIVLSDGTKVWLNAATVLKYPTSFRERTERRVKLVSGEAYFEVAKDPKQPFIVASGNQELTVIGTHFNINTYTKTVKTVLLEGSVKLKSINSRDSISLHPGEESAYHGNGFQKHEADINLAMAWKNGKLKFRNADLKSILDEAERWYNIKVEYEGKIPNIHLTGGISRKSSLATLLKLLQMSGVTFSLSDEQNVTILKIKS